MKISVIIATRNRAELLRGALSAIETQTRSADEVVVVDNGSTDNTKSVVMEFSARLPLKYVYESKPGVATARNTGIRNSSGEIIAFTDDDCRPSPTWLQYIEAPFQRDPSIGMVCGKLLSGEKPGSFIERFCAVDHEICEGDA